MQATVNNHKDIKVQAKLPLVLAGKLLPILSLLIITILFSRKLSYEDYGNFQAIWVLTSLAGTVLSFGLPTIILATPAGMLIKYLQKNRVSIVVGYVLLLLVAIFIISLGTADFSLYLKGILIVFILLQTACIIGEARLIKKNILRSFVIVNIVYAIVFFALHLFILYNSFSLEKLVSSLAILSALKLLILLLIKQHPGETQANLEQPFFIKNWLFTGFNEVLGIVTRWLDKIFVLYLLSAADFAIFYNGAFEIPLFAVLISAMENVMLSGITEDVSNKREAKNIFRESFKLLSLIAFPIFFFFLFTHVEAYSFIFDEKYNASIPVFLISLFIIPLRITHYGVILQCYGKANKLAFGSVMDIIISLALMFALYPSMGTRGIVLALVISTYLQVLYYLYQSAKTLEVKLTELVPLPYLLKLFIALGCVYLALSLLRNHIGPMIYLGGMFVISSTIVLAGLYRYFFMPSKYFRLINK